MARVSLMALIVLLATTTFGWACCSPILDEDGEVYMSSKGILYYISGNNEYREALIKALKEKQFAAYGTTARPGKTPRTTIASLISRRRRLDDGRTSSARAGFRNGGNFGLATRSTQIF